MESYKYNLNERALSTIVLEAAYIRDEIKIRYIVENAGASNVVRIEGRIVGQSTWDTLLNITGTDNVVVDVTTYEEVQVSVITFDSLSNYVDIIGSSFSNVDSTVVVAVDSVNGQTGAVVLDAADIDVAAGYTPGAGTVTAGDTIQEALEKLDGNVTDSSAAAAAAQQDIDDHIADATDAHDASAISNVPAGTIAATDIQAAINELDGDITGVSTDVADLVTLSGVAANSTDLGTFTGTIIPDNSDNKEAFQALETFILSIPSPFYYAGTWVASTNTPTLANTDVGQSGKVYYVTDSGTVDFGAGPMDFNAGDKVANNGTTWDKWDMTDGVASVNGQVGVVSLSLDDLSDVTAPTPLTNDTLSYNGVAWVNQPITAVSANRGVILFPDDTTVVDGYGGMPATPSVGAIDTNAIVVPAGTTVFGHGYIYNVALNNTLLPGGVWQFNFYTDTSALAGTSQLGFDIHRVIIGTGTVTFTGAGATRTCTASAGTPFVSGDANADQRLASYVQTPVGTFQITAFTSGTEVTVATDAGYVNESAVTYTKHALLFGVDSADINSTATILLSTPVVQPSFVVDPTDKIAMRVYGIASANRTINFYVNGPTSYSHVITTLAATHNDLAGLQGGNSTERYHLTLAEYDIATQAADATLDGYLLSVDWNTFNDAATDIAAHLIDTTDAHDASAISNIPAGNLAATDVQAALNELQSDIDSRALNSAGDINETSFSAANNQVAPADVTGFAFAAGVVRGFEALVSASIDATSDTYETFELIGINKSGTFEMSVVSVGDDTGVVFSITSAGQVQYTSTNVSGFVSDTIKFRAITTSV